MRCRFQTHHTRACRYVNVKMWQNRHPEATKRELEEQWRKTHKAVAQQLAPCLADTHDNPRFPLAKTFNFLDTVQALHIHVPSLLSTCGGCMAVSCALPGIHMRNSEACAAHPREAVTQEDCLNIAHVIPEGNDAARSTSGDAVRESSATGITGVPAEQRGARCWLFASDCILASPRATG